MAIDYSKAEQATKPTEDQLEHIVALARQQVQIEKRIAALKQELADVSAEYLIMRTETLPDAMKQIGLTEFALDNGAKITVREGLNANIKEENRLAAYTWLRDHGHGDIIKNLVTMDFGRGQDALKDVAVEFAESNGFDYTLKEGIHSGTLNAWAREQLENGEEPIPEELINVFRYDEAKVTLPKTRKKR